MPKPLNNTQSNETSTNEQQSDSLAAASTLISISEAQTTSSNEPLSTSTPMMPMMGNQYQQTLSSQAFPQIQMLPPTQQPFQTSSLIKPPSSELSTSSSSSFSSRINTNVNATTLGNKRRRNASDPSLSSSNSVIPSAAAMIKSGSEGKTAVKRVRFSIDSDTLKGNTESSSSNNFASSSTISMIKKDATQVTAEIELYKQSSTNQPNSLAVVASASTSTASISQAQTTSLNESLSASTTPPVPQSPFMIPTHSASNIISMMGNQSQQSNPFATFPPPPSRDETRQKMEQEAEAQRKILAMQQAAARVEEAAREFDYELNIINKSRDKTAKFEREDPITIMFYNDIAQEYHNLYINHANTDIKKQKVRIHYEQYLKILKNYLQIVSLPSSRKDTNFNFIIACLKHSKDIFIGKDKAGAGCSLTSEIEKLIDELCAPQQPLPSSSSSASSFLSPSSASGSSSSSSNNPVVSSAAVTSAPTSTASISQAQTTSLNGSLSASTIPSVSQRKDENSAVPLIIEYIRKSAEQSVSFNDDLNKINKTRDSIDQLPEKRSLHRYCQQIQNCGLSNVGQLYNKLYSSSSRTSEEKQRVSFNYHIYLDHLQNYFDRLLKEVESDKVFSNRKGFNKYITNIKNNKTRLIGYSKSELVTSEKKIVDEIGVLIDKLYAKSSMTQLSTLNSIGSQANARIPMMGGQYQQSDQFTMGPPPPSQRLSTNATPSASQPPRMMQPLTFNPMGSPVNTMMPMTGNQYQQSGQFTMMGPPPPSQPFRASSLIQPQPISLTSSFFSSSSASVSSSTTSIENQRRLNEAKAQRENLAMQQAVAQAAARAAQLNGKSIPQLSQMTRQTEEKRKYLEEQQTVVRTANQVVAEAAMQAAAQAARIRTAPMQSQHISLSSNCFSSSSAFHTVANTTVPVTVKKPQDTDDNSSGSSNSVSSSTAAMIRKAV